MTDSKSKGTQYRAVTNVSFGKDRAPVKAGDLFSLDDDDVAKDLLEKGAISKNIKPSQDDLAKENPTEADINKGEPPNAAMTRGMEADAKIAGNDVQGSAKGASAGGPGKTTASQK
jgi:hypothetical protein